MTSDPPPTRTLPGSTPTASAPGARVSAPPVSYAQPADHWNGGTLHHLRGGTTIATYTIADSGAFSPDATAPADIMIIDIGEDFAPWPDPADVFVLTRANGERWSASTHGAGTPGSPYTIELSTWQRLPDARPLAGSNYTQSAPPAWE